MWGEYVDKNEILIFRSRKSNKIWNWKKKKKSRNSSLGILFRNKDKQLKEQILLEGKFGAESWYYHLTV